MMSSWWVDQPRDQWTAVCAQRPFKHLRLASELRPVWQETAYEKTADSFRFKRDVQQHRRSVGFDLSAHVTFLRPEREDDVVSEPLDLFHQWKQAVRDRQYPRAVILAAQILQVRLPSDPHELLIFRKWCLLHAKEDIQLAREDLNEM